MIFLYVQAVTKKEKKNDNYPIGSFLVNVKLWFGRAWLIGIVAPWKKRQINTGTI